MGREVVAHLVCAVREESLGLVEAKKFGGAIDRDFFIGESAGRPPLEMSIRTGLRNRKFKMPLRTAKWGKQTNSRCGARYR